MIFASRTPASIIRTPEDDALIDSGDFRVEEVYGIIPSKFNNEPNEYLSSMRECRHHATLRECIEEELEFYNSPWMQAGRKELKWNHKSEHAYKVLTRLVALA